MIIDGASDGYTGTLGERPTMRRRMRISLIICQECDKIFGGGLGELFNSDGSVALPDGSKAAIMDCDKCGGSKSKFMFGLDTEEVSDG